MKTNERVNGDCVSIQWDDTGTNQFNVSSFGVGSQSWMSRRAEGGGGVRPEPQFTPDAFGTMQFAATSSPKGEL